MKPTLDLKRAAYVWLIPARYPSQRLGDSLSWLDKHEQEQAGEIYCGDNRELYLESRVWLRRLLSDATGMAPRALRLDHLTSGKSVLARSNTKIPDVCFDVSYTYSCIAIALCRHGEIGVDVQRVWALSNLSDATAGVLDWNDQKYLRTVIPEERAAAAARIRAAKEVHARTPRAGAALPFDQLHATLIHGQYCSVESAVSDPATFFSLAVKPDTDGKEYAVALSSAHELPLVLYRVPEQMQMTDSLDVLQAQQVAPYLPVADSPAIRYKKTA